MSTAKPIVSMLRQPARGMAATLRSLADYVETLERESGQPVAQDVYGQGALIEDFEQEIAALFGKPAALFLPSGTLAQPLALRIHAEHKGRNTIGLHPTSHLLLHEESGYQELWGLAAQHIGDEQAPFTSEDLRNLVYTPSSPLSAARGFGVGPAAELPAAVVWELPAREIGGQLPSWHDLQAQVAWAREHDIAVHFDGARLWQCQAAYGQSLATIAGLADSVYVSFYKDLAGISGAMLLGEADFIAEAKVWARRAGGNLFSLYPYILAAKQGVAENLASVDSAVSYARELGLALAEVAAVQVVPNPPQAAMFHLHIQMEREQLQQAIAAYAQEQGVEVLPKPRASYVREGKPVQVCEIPVGRNAMQHPVAFWQQHLVALLQGAK
ncbi:threonine aldolase family protein [Aliidiomarina sp.]|uniref:threonine aldolase family protein n=1 Tax=Aliidiomarina sp. TaxID=1872439 RepID=UPI003A4D912E